MQILLIAPTCHLCNSSRQFLIALGIQPHFRFNTGIIYSCGGKTGRKKKCSSGEKTNLMCSRERKGVENKKKQHQHCQGDLQFRIEFFVCLFLFTEKRFFIWHFHRGYFGSSEQRRRRKNYTLKATQKKSSSTWLSCAEKRSRKKNVFIHKESEKKFILCCLPMYFQRPVTHENFRQFLDCECW